MNTLPIEIINRINVFNSHPLADIRRPNTLKTQFGNYIYTDTCIKYMHNMIQDYADDFETIVFEKLLQHNLIIKYFKKFRALFVINLFVI